MLLRAVAVYAILAVVVSVPDIINEGESDEIDLSSSSEDDEDAHVSAGEEIGLISGQNWVLAAFGVEWRATLRALARRLHPHRAHRTSVPLQTTTHLTGSPHGSADPIY